MPATMRNKGPRKAPPFRSDKFDAAENALLGRSFEQVKAETYDRKFPELKALRLVPLDASISPNAESMVVRSFDQVASARLLASYADDLPRADVFHATRTATFKGIGASYGWDLMEARRSVDDGIPLQTRKANAARRAIETTIDRVLAIGDTASGLVGLLNQPAALVYTVPNGGGGATEFSTKTPDEILADLTGLVEFMIETTNEVERPNMVLMPRPQLTLIRQTQKSNASDSTIYDWFRKNYPEIGLDSYYRLAGAGVGGADRMMAYRLDPDALQGAVPQPFEQLPVQERNLEFIVPCHARVGGVFAYYPMSIVYADGI